MKSTSDLINEHYENHRLDNHSGGKASTDEILWLRNISETLDKILVILDHRMRNDS